MEQKKKKLVEEMTEKEKQKYYEKLEWKIRLGIVLGGLTILAVLFAITLK